MTIECNENIQYDNAPGDIREAIEEATHVEDFLPPPELLVEKIETKKGNNLRTK